MLNLHTFDGNTFSWTGRQLDSIVGNGKNISYKYNAEGIRTEKTVDGETTKYYLQGSRVVLEKTSNEEHAFFYDANGQAAAFVIYDSQGKHPYYYMRNAQGDVIGLFDASGEVVVRYTYDSWGKLISITDGNGVDKTNDVSFVGYKNPFRYRGYYYDNETGMYYLQSRYYNPEIGRFINADGFVSTGLDVLTKNMFAYCENNPINRSDPSGLFWKEIGEWLCNTFGAGSSTTATVSNTESPVIQYPSPITINSGAKTTQTMSHHGDSSKPISVYANKDAEHPIKSSSAGIKINASNFTLKLNLGLDNIGLSGSIINGNTTDSLGLKINLSEFNVGFESSSAIKWDDTTETVYSNVNVDGWTLLACAAAAYGCPIPALKGAFASVCGC